MYVVTVILLLGVLPVVSIVIETVWQGGSAELGPLIGKWFVFWAVGVRLFVAGIRQVVQPTFTARDIFGVKDAGALPIVREVGFGNLAQGTLGLLTLLVPGFLVPAAIVSGLYYGLAGAGHVARGHLNVNGWTALVSDVWTFVVLAIFVALRGF
jgi:hypothetical protein